MIKERKIISIGDFIINLDEIKYIDWLSNGVKVYFKDGTNAYTRASTEEIRALYSNIVVIVPEGE